MTSDNPETVGEWMIERMREHDEILGEIGAIGDVDRLYEYEAEQVARLSEAEDAERPKVVARLDRVRDLMGIKTQELLAAFEEKQRLRKT
jgi:hypothetical protein